jgi:hypothetical protein
MSLRKGKTKLLLDSAIDCALLAVEIYNKPRAPFRVETYITHMIIAWTRIFHAYFHQTIGDKYYYKKKGNRTYEMVDGERKAWELKTCLANKPDLDVAVKSNIEFFIKLRNKIEHRHIEKDEIGVIIFGECQSLLNNFENFVIECFGEEYALNECLVFSLQFSKLRTTGQRLASKTLLSKEVIELKEFIEKYRNSLSDDIFNKQEYSIKLISVPKVSNTNRNDLAVEFVNWKNLTDEEKVNYDKLLAIIKDKTEYKEVINPGRLKPGDVVKKINEATTFNLNHFDHKCLYTILSIRPPKNDDDPFNTNNLYCHYDEVHDDYVYQESWCEFIINAINTGKLTKEYLRLNFNSGTLIPVSDFISSINALDIPVNEIVSISE